jgi:uncharacterized protein YcbX
VTVRGTVSRLGTVAVKGLSLELVDELELTHAGPRGDRQFFLVDENARLVNNKGLGVLQQVRAVYDEDARTLTLRLPGGEAVGGEIVLDGEVEANFFGSPKRARHVVGPWSEALSELTGRRLRLVEPVEAPAVDRGEAGPVTLLSTGSLATLAEQLGVDDVDARRFRMHLYVDGVPGHAEDAWLGRRVRVGGAVVVPTGNVGRCAVTTQNPDTGRPDLDTLKGLAGYRRGTVSTEPLPFGVHARVERAGTVRLGDAVTVE